MVRSRRLRTAGVKSGVQAAFQLAAALCWCGHITCSEELKRVEECAIPSLGKVEVGVKSGVQAALQLAAALCCHHRCPEDFLVLSTGHCVYKLYEPVILKSHSVKSEMSVV